jgi:hypothetical protein
MTKIVLFKWKRRRVSLQLESFLLFFSFQVHISTLKKKYYIEIDIRKISEYYLFSVLSTSFPLDLATHSNHTAIQSVQCFCRNFRCIKYLFCSYRFVYKSSFLFKVFKEYVEIFF